MSERIINTPIFCLLNLAKKYKIGVFYEQYIFKCPNANPDEPEEMAFVKLFAGNRSASGQAPNLYLARQMAATDMLNQLKEECDNIPKFGLVPGSEILNDIYKDLHNLCTIENLTYPVYSEVRDEDELDAFLPNSNSLFTIKCQIGKLTTLGWSILPQIAKRWSAKKMFEALTGEQYPFADMRYGDNCISFENLGISIDQTSNKRKRYTTGNTDNTVLKEQGELMAIYQEQDTERDIETNLKVENEIICNDDKGKELSSDINEAVEDAENFKVNFKGKWKKSIEEKYIRLGQKTLEKVKEKFVLMTIQE